MVELSSGPRANKLIDRKQRRAAEEAKRAAMLANNDILEREFYRENSVLGFWFLFDEAVGCLVFFLSQIIIGP